MDERITLQNFYDFASKQSGTYNYDLASECAFSQFLKSLGLDGARAGTQHFSYIDKEKGYVTCMYETTPDLAPLTRILAGPFIDDNGELRFDKLDDAGMTIDSLGGMVYNAHVSWEETAAAVKAVMMETV